MQFQLVSQYKPAGDQPQAIDKLTKGLENNQENQVLLGVTGSGKTYTIAKVIEKTQLSTLVISHNKTLAGQLYQEFRDFFPKNGVSYFVSYYDYYQPEAYLPTTDTYIEKETDINEEIDKMRLMATTNLQTRKDTIVVASVSCIYNLGDPKLYSHFAYTIEKNKNYSRTDLFLNFTKLQYERENWDIKRGTFRVRGDTVEIWPAYQDIILRLNFLGEKLENLSWHDPITGEKTQTPDDIALESLELSSPDKYTLFPAKHYIADPQKQEQAFLNIKKDLKIRTKQLNSLGKKIEAYRLEQKVNHDLDMISELGYVNGIENYSRYFDGRSPGDPPYTLIDYFNQYKKWLLIIDESHMTIPQIRGMYNGDRSRKQTLIDYGFRLPSALDNRPLQFTEFLERTGNTIFVSATPSDWELTRPHAQIVEQLIRPTGLIDPKIEIRPKKNQIENLTHEIIKRKQKGQRVLVTTLTKRLAEALTDFLNNEKNFQRHPEFISGSNSNKTKNNVISSEVEKSLNNNSTIKKFNNLILKVAYLHSDIDTLDRQDILDELRKGKYDVLVGINLLREGLDLPEVSLVAILDADKEGFLRSKTSLIQTMGRAARHEEGHVIMYADNTTGSMEYSIKEVERRRQTQINFNIKHNITPQSIKKEIRKKLIKREKEKKQKNQKLSVKLTPKSEAIEISSISPNDYTPEDKKILIKRLKKTMLNLARDLEFEKAAKVRDKIKELEKL